MVCLAGQVWDGCTGREGGRGGEGRGGLLLLEG